MAASQTVITEQAPEVPAEKPRPEQFGGDQEKYIEALTDYKTDQAVREGKPESRVQRRFDKMTRNIREGEEKLAHALHFNEQWRERCEGIEAINRQQTTQIDQLMMAVQAQFQAGQQLLAAISAMDTLVKENQQLRIKYQAAVKAWKDAKGQTAK